MKWSKPRHGMALRLHAIERARRGAAEAALARAAEEAARAGVAEQDAADSVRAAEAEWVTRMTGGQLDLDIGRLLSRELIERETERSAAQARAAECKSLEEGARSQVQALDAAVRSGERTLRKGRRQLSRKAETARESAQSDLTSWRWFDR